MHTPLIPAWQPEKYTFQAGTHHGKKVIWISFPCDQKLIAALKSVAKVWWSRSRKKWYTSNSLHYRNLFGLTPDYIGEAASRLSPENLAELRHYIDHLKLCAYSPNTLKTYTTEFTQLLKILGTHPVNTLTPERLKAYFLYCIDHLKLSENLIHSRMNAVKFYFEKVLHREQLFLDIPRPKKPSFLPKALSVNDIGKMFSVTENPKHRLLLKLCYGMGLRVSEIVNLEISHIDSRRMQVLISASKGKKDRYVSLPEKVLQELRAYYKMYKPVKYLFEGQQGGKYATRSVQQVFKRAMQKARINKKVGVHSLRHSYATHLIEQGTDIRFVQELLGHQNIKTTMVYTALTDLSLRKIQSPLDLM